MAYSTDEQELYDHLRSTLPRVLFQSDTAAEELWGALVKQFAAIRSQVDTWQDLTFITRSAEDAGNEIWEDQAATDRGTSRQPGETSAALGARLRRVEDVVTTPALETACNAVLAAMGLSGAVHIETLRKVRAFLGHDADGHPNAYCSRGYRLTKSATPAGFVVILPFGSGAALSSITDLIRAKKAAGFYALFETRAIP